MVTNAEIALALQELASYCDIAGEVKYKGMRYREVADEIKERGRPLSVTDLPLLPGAGRSIQKKLVEIMKHGTCDKLYDYQHAFGHLPELLSLTSIGPKRARFLFDEYGIESIKDLKRLVRKGHVDESWAKDALDSVTSTKKGRIPWPRANFVAAHLTKRIFGAGPYELVKVCGSLRRLRKDVKDIDIVVGDTSDATRARVRRALDSITSSGEKLIFGVVDGVPINVRFVPPKSFGACVLYYTGSQAFNVSMRKRAKRMGYKLNEYALWKGKKNTASQTEKEIFKKLRMLYRTPEDRG